MAWRTTTATMQASPAPDYRRLAGIGVRCNGRRAQEGTSNVNSLNVASKRRQWPWRASVVWFQGCDLHCRGCFNPASHPFDHDRDKRVEEVAEWVLACQGIEGLTLSGGEPFQQAGDLRHLCEYIKLRRPDFSIGVFSGHTLQELVRGRWHWKAPGEDAWIKGDPALFTAIKQFLDFGVFGRFRQTMACNDKPLCGSRNQEVVFFTNRYSPSDLEPQGYEVTISGDGGSTIITGFPPAHL